MKAPSTQGVEWSSKDAQLQKVGAYSHGAKQTDLYNF